MFLCEQAQKPKTTVKRLSWPTEQISKLLLLIQMLSRIKYISLSQLWLIQCWTALAAIAWLLLYEPHPDYSHGFLSQSITSKLCTTDHQNLVEGIGKCNFTIVCFNFLRFVLDVFVSQSWSTQGCIFTAFHAIISKKESVELFYNVRNGWNWSSLVLDCSLAKLLVKSAFNLKWGSCKTKACYFTKLSVLNRTFYRCI